MRGILARFPLYVLLGVTMLLVGVQPAAAAAPMAIDSLADHQLVGNSAGATDTYIFMVPQPVSAPTVSATFTPSATSDSGRAGFQVYLNGTNIAHGGRTPTSGVLQYTLPQNPSGTVVIQVFNYSDSPVSYTITAGGVPGGAPNGPPRQARSMEQAIPLNGTLGGSLPVNSSGTFAYYTFPTAGSSPPTAVSLTYGPADIRLSQAVGLNILDSSGNTITSTVQPAGQDVTAATIGVALNRAPGETLTVQVFNYAQGIPITYRLSVSGVPPPSSAPAAPQPGAPAFQSFWVENFVPTPLWSGPDQRAASFGLQPQFSSFLVVQPQTGPRLYVFNPRSHNYAYLDAAAAGPSGPPR